MCHKRISSFLSILNLGSVDDLLAEVTTEILRSSQVHLPTAKQFGELNLQSGHAQQTRSATRREINQYVDIAIRTKIGPERRSENSESQDTMTLTKRCQFGFGDRTLCIHGYITG